MKLAVLLGFGMACGLVCAATPAHAFEREWHLGGGVGVSSGNGLKMSPALSAYAAYGLSDVFDARVELTARGYHLGASENPNAFSAMAGVVYKLDVLSWVPWAGVYAGYLGFGDVPRAGSSFRQHDVALGLGAGLDYAFSRNFGLGVTLRMDQALVHTAATTFDALLRAEYRWGW